MSTVTDYYVVAEARPEIVAQKVRDRLPQMQPFGSMVTNDSNRLYAQAMVRTAEIDGSAVVTDGQKLTGIDIGDDTGDVTFTVVNGQITGIVTSNVV